MLVFLSMSGEMKMKHADRLKTAKKVFRDRGGIVKIGEAFEATWKPPGPWRN